MCCIFVLLNFKNNSVMKQKTFKKYFSVDVKRRESAFYEDDFNDVVEEMWIEVIDRRTIEKGMDKPSTLEHTSYYWDGKNLHVDDHGNYNGFTLTKTPYITDVVEKYVKKELI
jgi:hypothetical protein